MQKRTKERHGKTMSRSGDDMGFWEYINENGRGSFIGAALGYLITKKPGCGCLVVLILIVAAVIFLKTQ